MAIPIFAIVVAAAVQAAARAPAPAGSLAGCISDTTQQIPGATVVAKGGGAQRTTVSDAAGCYELNDLPPASYRVTARLTGFDNVTRDRVVLAPGTVTHLDFAMRPSAICECIAVGPTTLADQWARADAVVHVRLSDPEPAEATPPPYYRHTAKVLHALKQPPAAGARAASIFVLQNQSSGALPPYDVGQELVMFLALSDSGAFVIANDGPGSADRIDTVDLAMVFLIEDGRIRRAPPGFASEVGTRLDVLLEALRTVSRGGAGKKPPAP